ncbi:MAG: hypothetical protein WA875_01905 [Candidatus Acidiferrales bacterium]
MGASGICGAARAGGAVIALILALGFMPQQPDRTAELQARYKQQTSAVSKGKMMPQLGDAEFQVIQKHMAAGEYTQAATELGQYRDQVRETLTGLDALGVDAEKHSSGFRQLEISLRQSLRRIADMMVPLTADEQQPFLEVRKDLDGMDQHLIRELFPRESHPSAAPESGAATKTGAAAPKQ